MVGGRDFSEQQFNVAVQGKAAARLGVQAVRARDRAGAGHQPREGIQERSDQAHRSATTSGG